MAKHQLRVREVQLARYRLLEREVTDPLAACLLHDIVKELEAELRREGRASAPDQHGRRHAPACGSALQHVCQRMPVQLDVQPLHAELIELAAHGL
jgi:hypothetical protein